MRQPPTTTFLTGDGKRSDRLWVCGECGASQWAGSRRAPKCPAHSCHGRMQ